MTFKSIYTKYSHHFHSSRHHHDADAIGNNVDGDGSSSLIGSAFFGSHSHLGRCLRLQTTSTIYLLVIFFLFQFAQSEGLVLLRRYHDHHTTTTTVPSPKPPWPSPPPWPSWRWLPFVNSPQGAAPFLWYDAAVLQVTEGSQFWYCPMMSTTPMALDRPHHPRLFRLDNSLTSALHQPSMSCLEYCPHCYWLCQRSTVLYFSGKLFLAQATESNYQLQTRLYSPVLLILLQNTSVYPSYCYSPFPASTMTTRPSRKAPSSLLSATMASSARTRSSSQLRAALKVAATTDDPTGNAARATVDTDVAGLADHGTAPTIDSIIPPHDEDTSGPGDVGAGTLGSTNSNSANVGTKAVSEATGNAIGNPKSTETAALANPSFIANNGTGADGTKMSVESTVAAASSPTPTIGAASPSKAYRLPHPSGTTSKSNSDTTTASTDIRPPPKNLYSIFAAKPPSKSPPLTFTPLGKTRATSTKQNVSAASPSAAVATSPTEVATEATLVTVAVDTSPVAKDADDASKKVPYYY